jgi:S1-C subfamily serine protease
VLDEYSRVVSGVAARLLRSVASLSVARRTRVAGAASGSAVVLSSDGLMLTAAHVVGRDARGSASFPDGRVGPFVVVGRDSLSDLAVVRTEALGGGPLEPVVLGNADDLRVGQLVVAVGSPLGYAGSVTAGIVSGLGRSLPARDGDQTRIIDNVIQTDAALHPGNSGGALADAEAAVVGINTAVAGPGFGQGLGLAVPINTVTETIVAELISHGKVRRAQIGIAGGTRPLPPRSAASTGYTHGFEVIAVTPGSPADRAGVHVEDVLVDLDGIPVRDAGDLQRLMTGHRIGAPVDVRVVRGGRVQTVVVVPEELATRS